MFAGTDEDGVTTYAVAPLAEKPAADLARKQGWEAEYVGNLRSFVRQQKDRPPESPLVRDLLTLDPRRIKDYTKAEKRELDARIQRALPKVSERHGVKLNWLRAECERHLENLVTADDLYREIANHVVGENQNFVTPLERVSILLEAGTVAKARLSTEPQLRRAIQYLEAIRNTEFSPMRVIGMLTEFHAMLGDSVKYKQYADLAAKYKEDNPYERSDNLDDALERARMHIQRRTTKASV